MNASDARDFWNARYSGDDYLFGDAPNAFLKAQAARLKPGLRALAVADGEGRNGVWLAQQGLRVITTDISPAAVAKARALAAARQTNLDARVADLETWDWPEQEFDVVVGVFIQFAGPDARARLFGRMKRALKPGGLLLLQGYRPEQLDYGTGGPGQVENLYTEDLLRAEFADFDIDHLESHDSEIHEGTGHRGLSALIDLVARRPASARV